MLLQSPLMRMASRRLCASERGTTGRTSTHAVLGTRGCARLPEPVLVCSPSKGRPSVRCGL